MFAIQLEDNMNDQISVLPHIAVDGESAYALMQVNAAEWIKEFCLNGFDPELVCRPGVALDIVSGDNILASYTTFPITGVFSIHGQFGFEIRDAVQP